MIAYYINLIRNSSLKLLLILIALDVIFGILRSIREHSSNSCIGIDGIIRKFGMIISILFFIVINDMINLNLIGFIPEDILQYLPIERIGIGELFNIIYICFELLSILKNMYRCKLPIPKKVNDILEKILKEFTTEIY